MYLWHPLSQILADQKWKCTVDFGKNCGKQCIYALLFRGYGEKDRLLVIT